MTIIADSVIKTVSFDFDPGLTSEFIDFSQKFLRNYPYVMIPFAKGEKELLHAENPFFSYGEMKRFLAYNAHGEVIGRIAAIINPRITFTQGKLGLIGFFDVIEEEEAGLKLLDSAVKWLRENDCTHVWGPMNFSVWYGYRFAVDNFDQPAYFGEPKNPPHYPDFFLKYGFKSLKTWKTGYYNKKDLNEEFYKNDEQLKMFLEQGYLIERFDMIENTEQLRACKKIIDQTFTGFLGYYQLTEEEFKKIFQAVLHLADHRLSMLLRHEEEYVGFIIAVPNMASAIQTIKERMNFWSIIRYRLKLRKIDEIMFLYIAVNNKAIKAAIKEGRLHYGKPLSITKVITSLCYQEILSCRKYKTLILPLMLSGSLSTKIMKDQVNRERNYELYELLIPRV